MYPKKLSKRWLIWLAQRMVQESQSQFYIEQLQPNWLQTKNQKLLYRLIVRLIFGLVAGPVCFMHYGSIVTKDLISLISLAPPTILSVLLSVLFSGIFPGFIPGIISGIFFIILTFMMVAPQVLNEHGLITLLSPLIIDGVVLGLFLGLIRPTIEIINLDKSKTQIVKTIQWSWPKAKIYSSIGAIFALIYVSARFVLTDRYFEDDGYYHVLLELLFISVVPGIVGGLSKGLDIETTAIPNQGIWRSVANARVLFFILTLVGMIIALPYSDNFHEVISQGLAVGLLGAMAGGQFSGLILIQHFSLRLILWWNKYIPWNYAHFLDYGTERILLQQVGGGYIFEHRLLMEHFASLEFRD